MGQKVHPIGIRLGIAKDWNSTWYADKDDFADQLNSDLKVRDFLQKRLAQAAVSSRFTLVVRIRLSLNVRLHARQPRRSSAAFKVFFIKVATVMGPTPPGTGVIQPATLFAA